MSEQIIERLEGGMQRRAVCLVYTEGCTDGIIVCDTDETANGFIRMEQESVLEKILKIKRAWMYEKVKETEKDVCELLESELKRWSKGNDSCEAKYRIEMLKELIEKLNE